VKKKGVKQLKKNVQIHGKKTTVCTKFIIGIMGHLIFHIDAVSFGTIILRITLFVFFIIRIQETLPVGFYFFFRNPN